VNTVVALDAGADAGADEEDADEEGADVAPEVDGAELPEPLLPQAASSPAAVMTAAAASSAPLGPAARAARIVSPVLDRSTDPLVVGVIPIQH
jgi:hypothetical protein